MKKIKRFFFRSRCMRVLNTKTLYLCHNKFLVYTHCLVPPLVELFNSASVLI